MSGIWDLGRDKIDVTHGFDFKRPFTMYTDAMKNFLKYEFPKVLFLEHAQFETLKPDVRAHVIADGLMPVCWVVDDQCQANDTWLIHIQLMLVHG